MVKIQCILLILCLSGKLFAQQPAENIPNFIFHKFDGTIFTEKNIEKKKPVLFIFFDVTCEHCLHAMHLLNKNYQQLNKATVYLITLDNPNSANIFIEKNAPNLKNKKNITFLQDLENMFIVRFHPKKYPSIFLYSVNKKLLFYDDDPESLKTVFNKLKIK